MSLVNDIWQRLFRTNTESENANGSAIAQIAYLANLLSTDNSANADSDGSLAEQIAFLVAKPQLLSLIQRGYGSKASVHSGLNYRP